MEGSGYELGSIFFLLSAPLILSHSPPPPASMGDTHSALPKVFPVVLLLAAAQLSPSVWSNPKCNGRGKKEGPAQAEGGKEH